MNTIFEIWDGMSIPFIIFTVVVVIATLLILLDSEWSPILLGGEFFVYKVLDRRDNSSSIKRVKEKQENSSFFVYELQNGPIYEGSNKLIHILVLLFFTYYSFGWVLLSWFGMYLVWLFATQIYFWYAGGVWINLDFFNQEMTNWEHIGPSKSKTTSMPFKNFGSQKWIVYYSLFFIALIYPEWVLWQAILVFFVFILLHMFIMFLFISKINYQKNIA